MTDAQWAQVAYLPADPQAAEPMQVGEGALDDPASAARRQLRHIAASERANTLSLRTPLHLAIHRI